MTVRCRVLSVWRPRLNRGSMRQSARPMGHVDVPCACACACARVRVRVRARREPEGAAGQGRFEDERDRGRRTRRPRMEETAGESGRSSCEGLSPLTGHSTWWNASRMVRLLRRKKHLQTGEHMRYILDGTRLSTLGVTCQHGAAHADALSAIICAACCAAIRSRGFHVANGNCLLCAARLRMVNHSDSRSGHSIRRQSQRDPAGAIMNRNPKRANDPDLGAAPHLSPTKRLHMHAEGAAPHLSPTMLPLPAARGRRPPSAHSRARVGDEA